MFFKLVVQGLREIGVSYCVHNVTTAVLQSMETHCSGHFMYTIRHTYFQSPWTTNLKNTVVGIAGVWIITITMIGGNLATNTLMWSGVDNEFHLLSMNCGHKNQL